jgi:hypothetical protein
MVDVRIRVGLAGFGGDDSADWRGMGVIGGAGLVLLTGAKAGLQAGVCGDGAVSDACDATDVEY